MLKKHLKFLPKKIEADYKGELVIPDLLSIKHLINGLFKSKNNAKRRGKKTL